MLPRYLSTSIKENFDIVLGMTDNRIASGIRRNYLDLLIRKAYVEGYKDAIDLKKRRI